MENDNKAVIPAVENKESEVKPQVASPEELALKLKELEADNLKLSTERENYRIGMLKAKGKMPAEEVEENKLPNELEDFISQKVEAILFDSKKAELDRQKEELFQKALKENEELRRAVNNPTPTPVGGGSNQDKVELSDNFGFTPEYLAEIKKRGLDPAVVRKNMTGYNAPSMPTA